MNDFVMTVTQLNKYVKMSLEGDANLSGIFLSGEITNFRRNAYSGHLYFSLSDESAAIKCVMFKSSADRLKFAPQDGLRVICRGRVSLYERDGVYQFYAADMQPDGLGSAALALSQIKERLAKEGLLDLSRKRPIPKYPQRIAAVTSGSGAALRDIINIVGRRYPLCELMVCPVTVQGDTAAAEINAMLLRLSDMVKMGCRIDTVIIGRGGGSAEDLAAFNDETLARTVAHMPVPVISAVGHETDYSLCDLTADMRAPTPSAAAELAVPDIAEMAERLFSAKVRLKRAQGTAVLKAEKRLDALRLRPCLTDKDFVLQQPKERLSRANEKLAAAFTQQTENRKKQLSNLAAKLNALSPLSVMARGFSAVRVGGRPLFSAAGVAQGDKLTVTLPDGCVDCTVDTVRMSEGDSNV